MGQEQLTFFSPVSPVTGQTAWPKEEHNKRLDIIRARSLQKHASSWEQTHDEGARPILSGQQFTSPVATRPKLNMALCNHISGETGASCPQPYAHEGPHGIPGGKTWSSGHYPH